MSDAIERAKASFSRWNTAFNARDMDAMVAEMHFPHRRLSGENEFQVWRTEDDFRATRGDNTTASLNAQAWGHTATTSMKLCNQGRTKCISRLFSRGAGLMAPSTTLSLPSGSSP